MKNALRFAGLLGLIGGLLLLRRLYPEPYVETEDPIEIARRRWAYGSGPDTLAGNEDL